MKINNKSIFQYKKVYLYIAIFFIALQVLVFARNYYSDYMYFFWMCDFIPAIYALAFLTKNTQLIKGVINISFLPQAVYVSNFIYKTVLDLMGYATLNYTLFYTISTIVMHLATIYVLILTFNLKTKKESLYYSFVFLVLIYVIMLFFTPIELNINYVFTLDKLGFDGYSFLWIPIVFFFIVIPTYYMQRRLYRESKELIKTKV